MQPTGYIPRYWYIIFGGLLFLLKPETTFRQQQNTRLVLVVELAENNTPAKIIAELD